MTNPDQQLETAIVAAGANVAPRITPADIEANIYSEHYFTAYEGRLGAIQTGGYVGRETPAAGGLDLLPLRHVTFCVLILKNGTKVVGVNEGPVSPENFDPNIGREYARQKAIDQIWPMLGYELRSKLAAAPTDFRSRVRAEFAELQGRIDKLAAFLPTDTFSNLSKDEQGRLTAQLAAMQDYSNCLAERVAAFGDA